MKVFARLLAVVPLFGVQAEGAILEHLMALTERIKTDHSDLVATWGGNEGPKAIVAGDFDQDGLADFATANLDGSISLVYGMGDGDFEDPIFIDLRARTLRGLQSADFNGDTFHDFATTDPVSGKLHVILSHSTRSYNSATGSATGLIQWHGVRAVVSGHFNDDAHLDLALAGPANTPGVTGLRLLFGDGSGEFPSFEDLSNPAQIQNYATLKPVFNLVPFRREEDGQHSLALSHAYSSEIWTMHPINGGVPSYQAVSDPLMSSNNQPIIAMTIGGIQSMTARDLVTVSKQGNNILIYLDNGSLVANPWRGSTQVEIPIPGAPRSVEIVDMNGDGRNDLVVVLRNFDRMVIYENRESGFVAVSEVPTGSSPREVVSSEWNGDDLPDLLVMNRRSQDVNLFSSDQDLGGVGVSNQTYPVDGVVAQLAVRDLDNNGRDDVIQLHVAANEFSVRFSNPGGLLGNPVFYPTGINPISFIAEDFNHDGNVDLAITNMGTERSGSSLGIRYGNGDGTFGERIILDDTEGRMFAVVSADFDGDTITDLVVGYFDCRIVVFKGLADGSFERRFVHPFTYESRAMVSSDFDQDGDFDLAGVGVGGELVVLVNNGDFMSDTISQRYAYEYGEKTSGSPNLRVVERDGNDDPDLLIVTPDGILTYFGAEGSRFEEGENLGDGLQTPPDSIAFLDINGDSIEDIVVSCGILSCLSVYQGTAEGGFQFSTSIDVPSVSHIASGDLDGDGETDLVGSGSSLWTVLSNPPLGEEVQRQVMNTVDRPVLTHPVINEILSSNRDFTILGSDGGSPDAIEIYYGGSSLASLENGTLQLQTASETVSYTITETAELTEGGRLVFICNNDALPYHTGFKLPQKGGTLTLFDSDGEILDSVTFPELESNTSYARYQDGFSSFAVNTDPDIGQPNLDNGAVNPDLKFETFLPDSVNRDGPLHILVTAQDDFGVFTLTMHYRRLDIENPEERSLLLFDDGQHGDGGFGDGLFANQLPDDLPSDALIEFFFTAVDLLGEQSSKPGSSTFGTLDQPTEHHIIRLGNSGPPLGLQISEVVSKNETGLTEKNGKAVDWIELRNISSSPIPLEGIELADDVFASEGETYKFPQGTVLQQGEYYIIFADNDPEDGPLHAPFRLDADGDRLILLSRDHEGNGTILDVREIPELENDVSWFHLGASEQTMIGIPTPGLQNGPRQLALIPDGRNYFVVFPTENGVPFSLLSSPDFTKENSSIVLEGNGNNIEQLFSGTFVDKAFYWLEKTSE